MSKELPLWNEEETDVLIEYQLQYGHVLLTYCNYKVLISKTQRAFKLKRPLGIYEDINYDVIPFNSREKTYLLNSENEWHFLFVEYDNKLMAIYAPHFLYFNNTRWMQLNKIIKGYLITSDQGDVDEYYYRIFKQGKLCCNVYWDKTGIHKGIHAPVEVYVNKKLVFSKKDDSKDLPPDLIEIISNDVVLVNDSEKKLKFKSPMDNKKIPMIKSLRHVVFSNEESKFWSFF